DMTEESPESLFGDLDESLIQAIQEAGFDKPTQVQLETLQPSLDGEDLFVSAETGSGKTCAYLLPAFEHLLGRQSHQRDILALVLVPTRELAQQVLKQAKSLARFTQIKLGHIGGGTDIHKQNELIREPPQFLVATPGRLSELIVKDQVDLSLVEILILDEADRLLDMGFSDEIMAIAENCFNRQQTQLFSASLTDKKLRGLAEALLTEPRVIALNKLTDKHEMITEQVVFADDRAHKYKLLVWLLQNESYLHCLVFCNSREQADQLYILMQQKEISAGILHGGRDQKQRNQAMGKLRRNQIKVIIATDIAARGIDIEGMDLVINFDMPRRGELYIHRIGRTGRAGEKGLAISLITAPEFNMMAGIERYLKHSFERRKIAELEGNYKGPKKQKSSGKAAGSKFKKLKKKDKVGAGKVKKKKITRPKSPK
ncbi:MAG: DEAD/DEAH box helicase, partial [Gammaproteobacteria bacterium]|nr:DEAD/DEAH box helicase [Gammaproteobacteria bacterium]